MLKTRSRGLTGVCVTGVDLEVSKVHTRPGPPLLILRSGCKLLATAQATTMPPPHAPHNAPHRDGDDFGLNVAFVLVLGDGKRTGVKMKGIAKC